MLTGFADDNDAFKNFRVFSTLSQVFTEDSLLESDFFPETFDKVSNASLGYEWITGSKVALTLGVAALSHEFAFSHFAILGTPMISCIEKIKQLAENEELAFYNSLVFPNFDQQSQILDITANPSTGKTKDILGAQYENCISLSLSLDDRGTPIPDFMSFDPETRTFTVTPTPNDMGLYKLFVNFNYINQIDAEKPLPEKHIHEHTVPLKV